MQPNQRYFSFAFTANLNKPSLIMLSLCCNKAKADKINYKPISILSKISQGVWKTNIEASLRIYFEKILSSSQCEFQKGYSVLQWLLVMIENLKNLL